jgi:hypothetical protein
MSNLSSLWSAYSRLQTELAHREVNSQSWGLEAGLNSLLKFALDSQPPTTEDIDRTVASGRRRERHRTHLQLLYHPSPNETVHPDTALHCRHELLRIKAQLGIRAWTILRAVGEGWSYKELATAAGMTPGNLRVRILRLRHRIGTQVAA